MTIKRAQLGAALGGLVLIALILPFESTVVRAASVRIVDSSGNSMPDVFVQQEWHDVTVEDEQHVDLVKTDQNGVASFPIRRVRSFLLKRLLNLIWRISTQGMHASIGSSGAITAYANGDPYVWGWVGYNRNGGAWPKEIELKRWDAPAYQRLRRL
ncbi:MAG: hypothetical protein ACREA9_04975 [Pyrinomonadaceae bacterium]